MSPLGRIQVRIARDAGPSHPPPDEGSAWPIPVRLLTPVLLVGAVPLAWHWADRIVWAVEAWWPAQAVIDLVVVTFLSAVLSACAVRYERVTLPAWRDHVRQCGLVYWVLLVVVVWTAWAAFVDASAVQSYSFDPYRLPSLLIMSAAANGAVLWLVRSWRIADAILDSRRRRR